MLLRDWDNVFQDMPSSLVTSFILYDNLPNLKKVNFIGLGSLSFVLALARYFLFKKFID